MGTGMTHAHAVAVFNAIKATGAIVQVDPDTLTQLVGSTDGPLVITARGGFMNRRFKYVTHYRGFLVYTSSPDPLPLGNAEFVAAKRIWVPSGV